MWTGYVTTDGRIETFWFNTKNGRRAIGFLERKAKANGDFGNRVSWIANETAATADEVKRELESNYRFYLRTRRHSL